MASLTITLVQECAAQNHFALTMTGALSHACSTSLEELTAPITDSEKDALIKLLVRVGKIGRTNAQVRNALIAGYTITI